MQDLHKLVGHRNAYKELAKKYEEYRRKLARIGIYIPAVDTEWRVIRNPLPSDPQGQQKVRDEIEVLTKRNSALALETQNAIHRYEEINRRN